MRTDEEHEGRDHDGQNRQDPSRQTSLGGMRANLAQQCEPASNDMRRIVQNFGQVAAGFPLNGHGGRNPLPVGQRKARDQGFERRREIETVDLLLEADREFSAQRVPAFGLKQAQGGI